MLNKADRHSAASGCRRFWRRGRDAPASPRSPGTGSRVSSRASRPAWTWSRGGSGCASPPGTGAGCPGSTPPGRVLGHEVEDGHVVLEAELPEPARSSATGSTSGEAGPRSRRAPWPAWLSSPAAARSGSPCRSRRARTTCSRPVRRASSPRPSRRRSGEAWVDVLAGDTASASRRYEKLLRRRPGLRPGADRAGRTRGCAAGGSRRRPPPSPRCSSAARTTSPALVGAGSAAFRQGDLDAALGLYRRAQAVAPDDAAGAQAAGRAQAAGHRAPHGRGRRRRWSAGTTAAAAREYAAALEAAPELAGVRLALAELLVAQGDVARRGGARSRTTRRATGRLPCGCGALLPGSRSSRAALEVYRGLLARDPGDVEARAGESAAREGPRVRRRCPRSTARIADAPRVTRADLAALLAVRVTALCSGWSRASRGWRWTSRAPGRGEQVARVLALGIMDVYPNHTFQPRRRRCAASTWPARRRGRSTRLGWPAGGRRPRPPTCARSHLDYEAVERVARGRASWASAARAASSRGGRCRGREAIEVVEALARLVRP